MPLSPGDNLGQFNVVSLLGKGGMGEVYRARDTQLKREVALKVLPDAFASDPERLARFQREAEVLASLNHPNIAAIYGIVQSGGSYALVMELVIGESPKGPLGWEDAWKLAQQMASALEYAHEKNIVHRDLKPANIVVTADGVLKLLDFGLAKAMSTPITGSLNSENSPTLTMGATVAGTIMGTAGYMAPEQAKGKNVDKRADVWAFGVVLWELLTGERLFTGEDVAETLAQLLTKEVDLTRVPSVARRLLTECLQKDPKARLRDIGDASRLIGDAAPPAVAATRPPVLPWAVAAVFALVAGVVSFVHFRETPPEVRAINTTLLPPDNADFEFARPFPIPAISPDGTRIVYGARTKDGKTQLWLRRLDSASAQPLAGTEGAGTPFWSPDSRWVAFGQDKKLKKIDIQGGPPVPITDLEHPLRGGSWNSEGVILFAGMPQTPILRVAASGGKAVAVTKPENHHFPFFLPDGRHFIYITGQDGDNPVQVGSLDEPAKPGKIVAQAHSPAVYSQRHLLFLRENTLMAQPFDVERLETTGEVMPVAEGVPTFTSISRIAGFTVSPAGLLAYVTGARGGQSRLLWKDRQGKVLDGLGTSAAAVEDFSISRDQKSVGVVIGRDLWVYDAARGVPTRFTFDQADNRDPVWSPDGKTLYFISNRGRGAGNLYRKALNGTGAEEPLLEDSARKSLGSVSPDGKWLLYSKDDAKARMDLWALPLTPSPGGAKAEARVFLQTRFSEYHGQFSADGQWVVYQSNESGNFEVYVAPFPGPGGKRQISSGGGTRPRWRRDGKEIFYCTIDGRLMAAEVAARNGTLEVGRVQNLFDDIDTAHGSAYDVSADGQKFLVVDDGVSGTRPLTLLQNWTASLRK